MKKVVLLLVLAAAIFLQFWRLDVLPPGLHPVEATHGLQALGLTQNDTPHSFFTILLMVAFDVWETTPWTIRAVSAVGGVLLVLATYAAAAALSKALHPDTTDAHFPLIAALVVILLFPVVQAGRFGAGMLWGSVLAALTVACFWQGVYAAANPLTSLPLRRRLTPNRWHLLTLNPIHPATPQISLVLTGIGLGISPIFPGLTQLWPLTFILLLLMWGWQRQVVIPQWWRGLGVAFVLTFIPALLLAPESYWNWFTFDRSNLARVLTSLVWRGSHDLAYNLPGRPFWDGLQVLGLGLGMVAVWRRGRTPQTTFLLTWLIVALFQAILSPAPQDWQRLTFAAAPLALLIALGFSFLSDQLPVISHQLFKRSLLPAPWPLFTVYCLLFISAALTTRAYFITYANHPDLPETFAVNEWRMAQHAAAYPPETLLYLLPPQTELPTVQFGLRSNQRLWRYTADGVLLPLGRLGTPVLYLVRDGQPDAITQLTDFYPDATFSDESLVGYSTVYVPAHIPRLPQTHPTDVLFGQQIGLVDWSVEPVDDGVEVKLYWQAALDLRTDYVAYVRLVDETGTPVAFQQSPLIPYPTDQWHRQEIVQGTFRLSPRPQTDTYQIVTGFYEPLSQTTLGEHVLTP